MGILETIWPLFCLQYLKLVFGNMEFLSALQTRFWQCGSCDWTVLSHANRKRLRASFGTMSHIDRAADTFSTPNSCCRTFPGREISCPSQTCTHMGTQTAHSTTHTITHIHTHRRMDIHRSAVQKSVIRKDK